MRIAISAAIPSVFRMPRIGSGQSDQGKSGVFLAALPQLESRPFVNADDRHSRSGFTLIELVVVVLIVASLTSVTVISLRPVIQRSRLRRAAETLASADQFARSTAFRENGAICRFERDFCEVSSPSNQRLRRFRLPDGVTCSEIRVGGTVSTVGRIFYDGRGISPTFALRTQTGTLSLWRVHIGISGQVTDAANLSEVQQWLTPLANPAFE